jgi:tRNA A58 N-methylase Trm61
VETPPIKPVEQRSVTLTASWNPNGYTTITRTKILMVRGGENAVIDLTRDDPGDRVRVIYVPTPADVADEMVRLAGVSAADVVFEPGCGDARITIAAVKAGATRAICVDLDPLRAEESRANVQRAGLAARIDVRQGDALDVKDLSDVSVVFLYMGDHFNMLIRPVLWRMLKPGSRVVSHRFLMGDWQPDKTVTVQSVDGGSLYDLHLWTITDEMKRKAR